MKEPSRTRRWILRLLTAVLVPLGLLAGTEGILRLTGFGYPTRCFLPDEVEGRAVYRDNPFFSWTFFDPENARFPMPFAMDRNRGEDALRVMVLGGSAAAGDPAPAFGFSRILEVMLGDQFPERRVEVVNAAVTAVNSHVMRRVAMELNTVRPDVVVVYMGNNEVVGPYGPGTVLRDFSPSLTRIRASIRARSTRLGQAALSLRRRWDPTMHVRPEWQGMELFLETRIPWDAPVLDPMYDAFERNLRDVVRAGRHTGARVLVCTVAVNLADAPPFTSGHDPGLDAVHRAAWQAAYDAGVAAASEGRVETARARFREALAIDDAHAELHFRFARSLAPGDGRAATHFAAARDRDMLRFRADSRINGLLRSGMYLKYGDDMVQQVDVEELISRLSTNGVPGATHFVDHVHFTFEGNYAVAAELFRCIAAPMVGAAGDLTVASRERCRTALALSAWEQRRMADRMISRMRKPPFIGQLGHRERLRAMEQAREGLRPVQGFGAPAPVERALRAMRARPRDWQLRVNVGKMLVETARPAEALEPLEAAMRLAPHRTESLAQRMVALAAADHTDEALHVWRTGEGDLEPPPAPTVLLFRVGTDLLDHGYLDQGIAWFQRLAARKPALAEAHNALGGALLMRQRGGEAETHLRRALEIRPAYPEALGNLGTIMAQQGDVPRAIEFFEQALEMEPGHAATQDNLARAYHLVGQQRQEADQVMEALELFKESVQLRPGWSEPATTLVRTLATHPDPAIRDLDEALAIASVLCERTAYEEVGPLVNLALAYAAAGRTEDARRTGALARQHAEATGDTGLVERVEAGLGRLGSQTDAPGARTPGEAR